MSYNDYMYAIDRSDEYLAHYGIKGMKWGVRKAIESGNSRKLARAYKKASRKLAKLEKRAVSGKKYARRAALLGAGAAAAGGLAAAGTEGVATFMKNNAQYAGKATRGLGSGLVKGGQLASKLTRGRVGGKAIQAGYTMQTHGINNANAVYNAGTALSTWGRGRHDVAGKVQKMIDSGSKHAPIYGVPTKGEKFASELNKRGLGSVSNNTLARAGAAAVGAGLAAGAGYNAYRAATTKRAANKAAQWRSEMNKAFKGTQYDTNKSSSNKKRRRR